MLFRISLVKKESVRTIIHFMNQSASQRCLTTALVVAVTLVGCSAYPNKTNEDTLLACNSIQKSVNHSLSQSKAENNLFAKNNEKLKIQAAKLLIAKQAITSAKIILASIDYNKLTSPLQAEFAIVQAQVAEKIRQNWKIFFWLDQKSVIHSPNTQLQDQAHIIKAKTHNRYGKFLVALHEWQMLSNINQLNTIDDFDAFWNTLINLPEDTLIAIDNQNNKLMKGWVELAILYRPIKSLDQQVSNLKAWRYRWKNHPANIYFPKDINLLHTAANIKKSAKITLILPINGPMAFAGQAIRDGFIAAYYQALVNSDGITTAPEVTFLDNHNKNILELVTHAKNHGTELIIGPLDKINVSILKKNLPHGVTIMALNVIEAEKIDNQTITNRFFEFGLSTEDEARAVARRGILDGHRRALILRPDSNWGKRASRSFIEEWLKLDGEIMAEFLFNNQTEFNKLASQALLIDHSQQRAKEISLLLGENIGFIPRRRHDIDMIYMPSNSEQARQLQPALSYQFAGKIPVYATSSAYSGTVDHRRDQDLENLRVYVMQWYLLRKKNSLEQDIIASLPSSKGKYGSLYAMGADAFKLYPYLQQLRCLPGSRINGLTGWLRINEKNQIKRELSWQIFRNGLLVPLSISESSAVSEITSKQQ